jgi:hypothetical protein
MRQLTIYRCAAPFSLGVAASLRQFAITSAAGLRQQGQQSQQEQQPQNQQQQPQNQQQQPQQQQQSQQGQQQPQQQQQLSKADLDNRSNQLNPNNELYWRSRGNQRQVNRANQMNPNNQQYQGGNQWQ